MEMSKSEAREWCERVYGSTNEYVLETQGGRECAVCGEPLAAGSEGIGEFVIPSGGSKPEDGGTPPENLKPGEHFIAHAYCGLDVGVLA